MWCVTVCKGDYRMPVMFTSYASATDFIESLFTSDEYEKLSVVLTVIGGDGTYENVDYGHSDAGSGGIGSR